MLPLYSTNILQGGGNPKEILKDHCESTRSPIPRWYSRCPRNNIYNAPNPVRNQTIDEGNEIIGAVPYLCLNCGRTLGANNFLQMDHALINCRAFAHIVLYHGVNERFHKNEAIYIPIDIVGVTLSRDSRD